MRRKRWSELSGRQYQHAVVLVMTISRSGEVDGLELHPRTESDSVR